MCLIDKDIDRHTNYKQGDIMLEIKKHAIGLLSTLTIILCTSSLMSNSDLDNNMNPIGNNDTAEILHTAEVMPEIEGGIQKLYKIIEYPPKARSNNVEGRVLIRFIVDKDGNVKQPEILKDIGSGCGAAAIKGLENLKFTPGTQDGLSISVYYTLPVTFKLHG